MYFYYSLLNGLWGKSNINSMIASLIHFLRSQCWIVWPQMGLMYRVIRKYREEMNIANCALETRKPFINHENFLNVYFNRSEVILGGGNFITPSSNFSLSQILYIGLGLQFFSPYHQASFCTFLICIHHMIKTSADL